MANGNDGRNRHFILEGVTETEAYRYPGGGGGDGPEIPERDRSTHAAALRGQLSKVRATAEATAGAQRDAGMEEGLGLQVEFESFSELELAFESLARENQGIELLNVRRGKETTRATVFVPDGKLDHFENLIVAYLERRKDSRDYPRDNRRLLDTIQQIRAASLRALWTDDDEAFPTNEGEPVWWEIWLTVRGNRQATTDAFRERAGLQGMRVAKGELGFPERTVLLARASVEQLRASMVTLNNIAELRRPKETAEFFDSLHPSEQQEWLEDLLARTRYPDGDEDVPYVCLLDTGVNRGHPLLSPALAVDDLHTVEPGWGTDDGDGHGTEMAGLALAGNLTEVLAGSGPVDFGHRLESVKLLPHDGATGTDPEHHGYLTIEAAARPEITAPSHRRVFGMTVTARDNRDRGRPSAWSSALDALAADSSARGGHPRLLVVSAGNVNDPMAWSNYPASNDSDGVHDPAQAWNVLTVGACTDLVRVTGPGTSGYAPIASKGGLSPYSTTSLPWERHWPLKPDIVMEGGNAARDSLSAVPLPSLSLLTTSHRPAERAFTTAHATSASSALAARLAARVMEAYPGLWPETVRGLIVHSAEWTDAMTDAYLPASQNRSKGDYQKLLRRCGFGVPDLDRALWSVANSLTMVVEETLVPFERGKSGNVVTREMQLHNLPWPQGSLEELGNTPVEMRVTLSYFIEPNPSRRGVRSRYRYESHGLRFDVKRPLETIDSFRGRISAAARDDEYASGTSGDDPAWLIGTQSRHRGSLHADIWRGTAADLASRGAIAVYPTAGWWKTRSALGHYERAVRYSLVVSIRAPDVDVDLYAEVANQIDVGVPVEI
ncbi:S8 family peptidase [Candidatus Palauibacter sp.]|uniref:S8 family peptidase n=1 Tax=Candidatus Palauibacter sp. TaxID=3101350 RepID=UPI003B0220C1